MTSGQTHLEVIKTALRLANKPLTSKEICDVIHKNGLGEVNGLTPWKTLAARLAQDIVGKKENSAFKRTFSGRYSLREWQYEPEVIVKPRKINPLEETIKAVPIEQFSTLLRDFKDGLYKTHIVDVLSQSIDVLRSDAEQREDIVQLIPTFVVEVGDSIISYKRTKRLPESRLHHTVCLNFGGHLQSDDIPALFLHDEATLQSFMYRELFEELDFQGNILQIEFKGILYLESSMFERQHAGIVYRVVVDQDAKIASLEPGMHTDLKMVSKATALENAEIYDSWSSQLVISLYGFSASGEN